MIDGRNCFDQLMKNDLKTYDSIQKITTIQGHDYTTGCLTNYPFIKEHQKLIAIDLSKKYALDADPNAIQQINSI